MSGSNWPGRHQGDWKVCHDTRLVALMRASGVSQFDYDKCRGFSREFADVECRTPVKYSTRAEITAQPTTSAKSLEIRDIYRNQL